MTPAENMAKALARIDPALFEDPPGESQPERKKRLQKIRGIRERLTKGVAKGTYPAEILDRIPKPLPNPRTDPEGVRALAAARKARAGDKAPANETPESKARVTKKARNPAAAPEATEKATQVPKTTTLVAPAKENSSKPQKSTPPKATAATAEGTAAATAAGEPQESSTAQRNGADKTPTTAPPPAKKVRGTPMPGASARLTERTMENPAEFPTPDDDENNRTNRVMMMHLLHDFPQPGDLPADITWHAARSPMHMGYERARLYSELHGKALDGEISETDAEERIVNELPATELESMLETTIITIQGAQSEFDRAAAVWLGANVLHAPYPLLVPAQAQVMIEMWAETTQQLTINDLARRIHVHAALIHWRELRRADNDDIHQLPATGKRRLQNMLNSL